MSRSRSKGWKDPRTYGESLDPLEFALGILNRVAELSENPELEQAKYPGGQSLNTFPDPDELFNHLHRIADAHPHAIAIHPVALDTRSTALHCIAEVAMFLLAEHPRHREQAKRIRGCAVCHRFFIHSEKKQTASNRYYCSTACRNKRPRTPEEKAAHAKRERERRFDNGQNSAALAILRSLGR